MKLSLVIPCYNEELNLPLLLERCKSVVQCADVEVIIVDNGSTDNTAKILASLLPRYPGCRSIKVDLNKGYGYGILQGLHASSAEYIGWTHADMQTDPVDVLEALDLISGSNIPFFIKGRRYGRPFADVFFTICMSVFESILLRRKMWDINSQPNIFPRTFFQTWVNPPHDFSLDLYAYFMAKKSGLDILRFPVRFGERANGVSHWNINWSSKLKFISRTLSYSFNLKKSLKI